MLIPMFHAKISSLASTGYDGFASSLSHVLSQILNKWN
jgi:hypothetical protein